MDYLENKIPAKIFRHLLSIPFIYGMIFPLIFWHIFLEIYHQVAFRLYGLELVKPKKYFKIDRYKLKKLSFSQKNYCVYCGYANGLLSYSVAIAGKTEKYWCGIKHNITKTDSYIEPDHHKDFLSYEEFK